MFGYVKTFGGAYMFGKCYAEIFVSFVRLRFNDIRELHGCPICLKGWRAAVTKIDSLSGQGI